MKHLTTDEIRQMWLDFFKERGHKVEPSSSLVPINDPTLLWINAGVAPLKKYFDGRTIPKNPRIVNAQKCIRTNDIENVGNTARHQTFFEMLGNFSVGDYFRDEIIPWAFELLTSKNYFAFDKDKLYITVYPADEETYQAWLEVGIDKTHLIKSPQNFWEIGEGPCGPDTEIFFDRGKNYGPFDLNLIKDDIENERFIEIWNIVFSQFNAKKGMERSSYKELPNKNIDTGMGLERMACVMQEVKTNFETDTFMTIIKGIEQFTSINYTGQKQFKIIADHIRTVTFAVSDGAVLSNEGRGYVLRRLLRRAIKHGKYLNIDKPFLHEIVDDVIKAMGTYYTALKDSQDLVKKVVKIEEEKFLETLDKGEKMVEDLIKHSDTSIINGKDAFTLYDTYGFPIELTKEIAEESNFTVDEAGFKEEMQKQKDRARNARKDTTSMNKQNEAYLKFKEEDTFIGYDTLKKETHILKSFTAGVVLEETPFYAESGGQVADAGVLVKDDKEYIVLDVQKLPNGQFLHLLETNSFKTGDKVIAKVDKKTRELTMYNHSATHLLFGALREVLGDHVSQQGSNVNSKALRFDFNNYDSLDEETLLSVEQLVNERILESIPVVIKEMPIEKAKALGAVAEFGEKYNDDVRVVNMKYTIDLCGGTHVSNTGNIEQFAIASIESKGSGIYRITGHANESVKNLKEQFIGINKEFKKLEEKVEKILSEAKQQSIDLSFSFKRNETFQGSYQDIIDKRDEFERFTQEVRELNKQFEQLKKEKTMEDLDQYLAQVEGNTLILKLEDIDKNALKPLADKLMDHLKNGVVVIANISGGKVTFIVKSTTDHHAGNLAKEAAKITGGGGGGRPDMAQAGGKNIDKVDEALAHIKSLLS
ncbi:MAG: alanine--tRNA ligase [Candidatus Izimaplasma sp.]|nr:alanine--tRNA ligase [Candidatus Izimaplasma bacterium]